MKIIETNLPAPDVYQFTLSANAKELDTAAQVVYQDHKAEYEIAGYEKGKATRKAIEAEKGEGFFHYEAVNILMDEHLYKLLMEGCNKAGVLPLGNPVCNMLSCDVSGFTATATVTVLPEVTLGQYKGLKASYRVGEVTDADVEKELARVQQRAAEKTVHEGPAVLGDTVKVDYCGMLDGEPFEGGTAENANITLGSGQFIPGFEEQIVGHSAGEFFSIDVTFPEQYASPALAGKAAVFTILLHETSATALPPLDDAFAQKVSDAKTIAELRTRMKDSMISYADARGRQEAQFTLLEEIGQGCTVEIPDVLLEQEYREGVVNLARFLKQRGSSFDAYLSQMGKTKEEFETENRALTKNALRGKLAAYAIARAEGLDVTAKELNEELSRLAKANGKTVVEFCAQNPAYKVSNSILFAKGLDFVTNAAVLTKE